MKKIQIYFLLMFLMAAMLAGCGKKTKDTSDSSDGKLVLYYLNVDEDGLTKVESDLDLSVDPEEAVSQVFKELSISDEKDGLYHALVNKQIKINSVNVDEKANADIDFGSGYSQMKAGQEVLFRAAFVKTITQIDGIRTVSFTVDGEPLTDDNGIGTGSMQADTFVLDNDKSEVYNYTETVDLYLANEDGDGLVEVTEDITAKNNQPMEEAVMKALMSDHGEGTQATLPDNLKINRISVIENICYVDLGEEIMDAVENVNDEIKVFSMVNSLTSLSRISEVQFTINGKKCKDMNGVSGFDSPLDCDYSYVVDENDM